MVQRASYSTGENNMNFKVGDTVWIIKPVNSYLCKDSTCGPKLFSKGVIDFVSTDHQKNLQCRLTFSVKHKMEPGIGWGGLAVWWWCPAESLTSNPLVYFEELAKYNKQRR